MEIYERIKARREELGMTQEDLALKTGYRSRSTINKIEKGIRDINQSQVIVFAKALMTTPTELMGWTGDPTPVTLNPNFKQPGFRIPVLGKIAAGVPTEAIEDIVDWEEITQEEALTGNFFGLVIKGDSMEPKFSEGDVVIVRKQSDCETGQVAVIIVNGCDATVKRIKKRPEGIMLIPTNPEYEPMFYSSAEMESLPVSILGRVVELRAKF